MCRRLDDISLNIYSCQAGKNRELFYKQLIAKADPRFVSWLKKKKT